MRQFAVIGLGQFGSSVALSLAEKGCDVMAIDREQDRVDDISDQVAQSVTVDAADEKALKSLGMKDIDVAIVSTGEDIEASISIVLILKEIGVKEIIAKAVTPIHGTILKKVGADRVVFPERDMGERIAESLASPNVMDYSEISETHSIVELVAPKKFWTKKISELNLEEETKVSIVAIKRKVPVVTQEGETEFREEVNIRPSLEEKINRSDILIMIGSFEGIQKVRGIQ
jgi:trk system potassium uptake protein TrkA